MRHKFQLIATFGLFAFAMLLLSANTARAFTFAEAEKLDKVEAVELLTKAREAANSGSISSARSFIAQARAKGATAAQIKSAEVAVSSAEDRAAQARQAEEARRASEAAVAQNQSGGGGSSSQSGSGSSVAAWRVDRQIPKANRPWWSGGAVAVTCTGGAGRGKSFTIDFITAAGQWEYNGGSTGKRSSWQAVAQDQCSISY